MGRRFPGGSRTAGGGAVTGGKRNQSIGWFSYGSYTWTVPTDIDTDVPLRFYLWGGGGAGGTNGSNGSGHGGGGGGLCIHEEAVAAGTTLNITVGRGSYDYNGRAGTTSLSASGFNSGTTIEASGGNSGYNSSNPSPDSYATGESSNTQSGNYGQGGIGRNGNIFNRRGGLGGSGSVNSGSGYGGGGGSAPAPHGMTDGFRGGNSI